MTLDHYYYVELILKPDSKFPMRSMDPELTRLSYTALVRESFPREYFKYLASKSFGPSVLNIAHLTSRVPLCLIYGLAI